MIIIFCISNPNVFGIVTYTETFELIDETGWGGVWNNDKDCGSAPPYSVAEIIGINSQTGVAVYTGVRESTHYFSQRYVLLHEAEDGGNTSARFFVPIDSSGNCDFYGTTADYILVGYFTGVGMTEDWQIITVGAADDNQWFEYDLDTAGTSAANSCTILTFITDKINAARKLGARNTTSILERLVDFHEAEPNNDNAYSLMVMSDVDNKIDIFIEEYDEGEIYCQGHFNSSLTFQEDWYRLDLSTTAWETEDISSRIDEDGRVGDFTLTHDERDPEIYVGVRNGDSTVERKILEHEAESTGYSGFSMSAETSSTGTIDLIVGNSANDYFWFNGYYVFTSVIPPISRTFTQTIVTTWSFSTFEYYRRTFTQTILTTWDFTAWRELYAFFTQTILTTWNFDKYIHHYRTFTQTILTTWDFSSYQHYYRTFSQVIITTWDFAASLGAIFRTFTQTIVTNWGISYSGIWYRTFSQIMNFEFVVNVTYDGVAPTVGVTRWILGAFILIPILLIILKKRGY